MALLLRSWEGRELLSSNRRARGARVPGWRGGRREEGEGGGGGRRSLGGKLPPFFSRNRSQDEKEEEENGRDGEGEAVGNRKVRAVEE
jgi:hypothetical protein